MAEYGTADTDGIAFDWCEHDSADGVDQAPFGPAKVMRCNECGWHFRLELDPEDFGQSTFVMVDATPARSDASPIVEKSDG